MEKNKQPDKHLKFLLNLSTFVILISGIFLLLFDKPLNTSLIRVIGMSAYVFFLIVLYIGYRAKKNSLSIFLMATLGAQGFISMISNAAFGFQAAWFTNAKFWDIVLAFIRSFASTDRAAFLIFAFYVLLLVFSGVLAISSYLLARSTLMQEVAKAKASGAA